MENNNCRNCRKFGQKLFLKGERCLQPKCGLTRRENLPGAKPTVGRARKIKKSEYGLQLAEKQKLKTSYGMRERQFSGLFTKAASKKTATGTEMLQMLERRLDNVVYRLGFAKSRSGARQLVNHGHIKVNDNVVDIPSYLVKEKDKITPKDSKIVEKIIDVKAKSPSWLKLDPETLIAEVVSLPKREEIDIPVDEQLIVEFYSR